MGQEGRHLPAPEHHAGHSDESGFYSTCDRSQQRAIYSSLWLLGTERGWRGRGGTPSWRPVQEA